MISMEPRRPAPSLVLRPTEEQDRQHVLFVSLMPDTKMDNLYPFLVAAISVHADVFRAKSSEAVIDHLRGRKKGPCAIIITDHEIASKDSADALSLIKNYILDQGGKLIFACHFGRLMLQEFDEFWVDTFALPWETGDFLRIQCYPNQTLFPYQNRVKAYTPTAAFIKLGKTADDTDSLYTPRGNAYIEKDPDLQTGLSEILEGPQGRQSGRKRREPLGVNADEGPLMEGSLDPIEALWGDPILETDTGNDLPPVDRFTPVTWVGWGKGQIGYVGDCKVGSIEGSKAKGGDQSIDIILALCGFRPLSLDPPEDDVARSPANSSPTSTSSNSTIKAPSSPPSSQSSEDQKDDPIVVENTELTDEDLLDLPPLIRYSQSIQSMLRLLYNNAFVPLFSTEGTLTKIQTQPKWGSFSFIPFWPTPRGLFAQSEIGRQRLPWLLPVQFRHPHPPFVPLDFPDLPAPAHSASDGAETAPIPLVESSDYHYHITTPHRKIILSPDMRRALNMAVISSAAGAAGAHRRSPPSGNHSKELLSPQEESWGAAIEALGRLFDLFTTSDEHLQKTVSGESLESPDWISPEANAVSGREENSK